MFLEGVLALNHTGAMGQALENVSGLAADSGVLFITTYNDRGWPSHYWHFIKCQYNGGSRRRADFGTAYIPYLCLRAVAARVLKDKRRVRRGMPRRHDLMD